MKLDEIMDALPALTPQQRAELVVRCQFLGADSTPRGVDTGAELLWRGLVVAMENRNQLLPEVPQVKKTRGWSKFQKECDRLDSWVKENFQHIDETERAKSYRIVAECLVRMVLSWDRPVTPNILMGNVGKATQAVDMQYPGYADSRLLRKYVILN